MTASIKKRRSTTLLLNKQKLILIIIIACYKGSFPLNSYGCVWYRKDKIKEKVKISEK